MGLKAVDFFCSGGGMSCGLEQAGIDVLAGVDIDARCKATYEANHKNSTFINFDISKMPLDYFETHETLKHEVTRDNDDLIFVGCSPCQYWSIINTDRDKNAQTKDLLNDFKRFVEHYKPGFVVVENVPGLFYKGNTSPLGSFINFLESENYKVQHKVIVVTDYGVPQTRKRFVMVASRISEIRFPQKNATAKVPTLREFIGDPVEFPPLKAGQKVDDFMHSTAPLAEIMLKRLDKTPHDGGTRMAWKDDDELQLQCYKDRDQMFKDVYGRLWWDRPSSTITTKFYSVSNGRFAHPEQNRGLSLKEAAALQTFPKDYVFKADTLTEAARMVGNAVPPMLAKRIGEAIVESLTRPVCHISKPKQGQLTF